MTQRPSGSPNAGRINCFPTKMSQPFLSQPILSQSRGAPQAGGGDDPWLVDTAGIGAGKAERKCLSECPLLVLS